MITVNGLPLDRFIESRSLTACRPHTARQLILDAVPVGWTGTHTQLVAKVHALDPSYSSRAITNAARELWVQARFQRVILQNAGRSGRATLWGRDA